MAKSRTPTTAPAAPADEALYAALRHDQIRPDPLNARKSFDEPGLAELAASLESAGMLQAPMVTPPDEGGIHTLVMGERRWRAWGMLIDTGAWPADRLISCRVETADEQRRAEAALIENLQRVDLNHMEAGLAFETLGARFHLANKTIAARIGRSPEFVQQHRRLAALEPGDQEALREGDLTLHDALEILRAPKAKDLSPALMLLVVELRHKTLVKPFKGYNYYGATEVAHDMPVADLKPLIDRHLVEFIALDHQTLRARVDFTYQANDFLRAVLPGMKEKGDTANATLREARLAAGVTAEEADALTKSRRYWTSWLNGPFPLSAEAEKTLADRKAREDKQKAELAERERQAAEAKAKRAARLAEIVGAENPRAAIVATLAELTLEGPFKTEDYGTVSDAKGQAVFRPAWIANCDQRFLGELLAAILNFAILPSSHAETGEGDRAEGVVAGATTPTRPAGGGAGAPRALLGDDFSRQIREALAEELAEAAA